MLRCVFGENLLSRYLERTLSLGTFSGDREIVWDNNNKIGHSRK
jgi:hypothetical protein